MILRKLQLLPRLWMLTALLGAGALSLGLVSPVGAATTASFNPAKGQLVISGDGGDNPITISRDVTGKILVNGGAIAVTGGIPTVANTAVIEISGQGGNDRLVLDETFGALPAAILDGGQGDDTLIGGSGHDQLFGKGGNDTLVGKGGDDRLFGGGGNDTLTGGDGNDQVDGELGSDRIVWNPGDDSDRAEGGGGLDTIEVNGGNGNEVFTVGANGTRVRFDRVEPAPFTLDIGTAEQLVLYANGGDDAFSAGPGLAALIQITVDGGIGNDSLSAGDGPDMLLGNDGDDTFVWEPGDGSVTIEGQSGQDTLRVMGADENENVTVSANGQRVRVVRDVTGAAVNLDDVELVAVIARGGADTITINDLAGTNVTNVAVNLEGTSGAGDGQPDTVNVNGTSGDNFIDVVGSGSAYSILGLAAVVQATGSEGSNDRLVINALGGNDVVRASFLPAGVVALTVDGGAGDDVLVGSQGADVLLGGDGNDTVCGNRGGDMALLGTGDDMFVWDPGDGNDTVEGQAGQDTLHFNGANIGEKFDLWAVGGRVRLARDVASIALDFDDVERVAVIARGGADTFTINDLAGTDTTEVTLNLEGATGGTGDGAADTVIVNGTAVRDTIAVGGSPAGVTVSGLAAKVTIVGSEAAIDGLTVSAQAEADSVDASGLPAGLIKLTLDGGAGADLLLGSPGEDIFVWDPGDGNDTAEGQGGYDTLRFSGANVGEKMDLAAVGGRVRLSRDVSAVTLDLNGIEKITLNALGGVDTITVNDLSGTAVTNVELSLESAPGSGTGDGQADSVIVNATNGDDVVQVAGAGGTYAVFGVRATVQVSGSEGITDQLIVNALSGADVVESSALLAGVVKLAADGGAGDDVLIGSYGDDYLLGGDGDDVLDGGSGTDVLDGGPGSDVAVNGETLINIP